MEFVPCVALASKMERALPDQRLERLPCGQSSLRRPLLNRLNRQPGLDATNWRAELAIRFGVILRKVWGGNRTWTGARAQSVLMSVWRTCWQQGRSALDFLSRLLRGQPAALALPP
jgi:transposase